MTSIVPSVISPTSSDISPPPAPPTSSSSPNSSSTSPSPTSQPNQTTDPPALSPPSSSSSPPPQAPPPDVPTAPPPSPPLPPPPASSPPPSLPTSPPPGDDSPPSPVLSPPPVQSGGSPPPQAEPAPPVATSPPPQIILRSPPPPANVPTSPSTKSPPSPPQQIIFSSPPPPANVPTPPSQKSPPSPPPQIIFSSPPPPATVPRPPSSKSPPSPPATPPTESSSKPPTLTPPPSSSNSPPPLPPTTSPSTPTLSSPPPSAPSTSSPPTVSPPATPSTLTTTVSPSSSLLPLVPTEKPTAKSTNGLSANATSSGKNGLSTGGAVGIGIFAGFIVLSLLAMAVWFVQKRKRKRAGPKIGYTVPSPFASSQNSDAAFLKPWSPHQLVGSGSKSGFYSPPEPGGVNNSRSWFTYEELIQATSGFAEHNLLGEGGFGCVYKGILIDGREVAVKQLKIGGGQGEREFRAEVEIISRVHHRHLVSLVGYCISEHQRLLVYDYVPNNTLHYHLHGGDRPVMDWEVRLKVAAGAAHGIAYLHEDCHPRIIHRDIKSSNILLHNNFEAQVSDFGLAKLALDSNTHVTTRVMGTFGFHFPFYLVCKHVMCHNISLGDESLVEWARPLLAEAIEHEDFKELVDPRLGKNYVKHEMFRMIEAAAACVRHSAAKRPRMSQVVRALDSLDESSDITNGMRPGQSGVFDSAQQSEEIRLFQRLAFGSQDYSSSFFNHTQSSWRSREYGSQGSSKSREHGNPSGRSQEHRDRSSLNP
ncbi:hypothetical protein HRI_004451200 [Hibiscus trionum]|uniref:non-specific serine/threonine protein kinase n=1 Tax=Hibiscus trionum TaxID=183268 RepID=A0A9W7J495_HIBTR|nr:hypothetical protein HRI_004451200 [Hibiscus trionum]